MLSVDIFRLKKNTIQIKANVNALVENAGTPDAFVTAIFLDQPDAVTLLQEAIRLRMEYDSTDSVTVGFHPDPEKRFSVRMNGHDSVTGLLLESILPELIQVEENV